uniref:Predicted RNA binding protein YcfA, dsRBD-like fold, HicA-like mRNA interferase family n=1 Tax=Candidatus Kentrum sp. SD TaxID=2126332 RepID=A0A451BMG3_9GAMM|nr:MAG: Predicted RNA binding protein YcfA, dsRBD-like fold, HicA-like mRNA interferase family [Candidatus Kentron sp. SD]
MPKLPVVSGAEAVRALERLGFAVARQRGSHIVLRRGSSGCVVPNHRERKTGMLSGILKQAGVSADEFMEALARSLLRPMNHDSALVNSP